MRAPPFPLKKIFLSVKNPDIKYLTDFFTTEITEHTGNII
jgi:hypothetical protein